MTKTQELKKELQEALPNATWSVRKTRCNGWVGQVIEATFRKGELTKQDLFLAYGIARLYDDYATQVEVYETN